MADPAERQTKTRLAMAVNAMLKARPLKQTATAEILGIPQPKVSALASFARTLRRVALKAGALFDSRA